MSKYCIHIYILGQMLDKLEQEFSSLSSSESPSYGQVLKKIKEVNEGLSDQLKADINYPFPTDRNRPNKTTTLLHCATKKNCLQIVRLLLNNNADANAIDSYGNEPLHLAAQNGNSKITQVLINETFFIDLQNIRNDTPLHYAAQSGNSEIIQELLNRGARVDVRNKDGDTAFEIAIKNGYPKIAEILSHNVHSNNSHTRSNEQATDIYQKLSTVKFNSNDSGNYQSLASTNQINSYVNQAVNNDGNKLAYYIGPTNSGLDSEEGMKDVAKHICKRIDRNGNILNDFYDTKKPLDKPFIVISNTDTALAQNPINRPLA